MYCPLRSSGISRSRLPNQERSKKQKQNNVYADKDIAKEKRRRLTLERGEIVREMERGSRYRVSLVMPGRIIQNRRF